MAHPLTETFLNILLPPRCLGCHTQVASPGKLCGDCWSNIQFIHPPYCQCCGFPFEYDVGEEALCGKCLDSRPSYDAARAVYVYDDESRSLITRFKYADQLQGIETFSRWMTQTGAALLEETDIIMPVPLHRIRLFTRRYNQAAMLAQSIGRLSHIPVRVDMLYRTRHNPAQASLNKRQRHKNVRGAFAIRPRTLPILEDQHVLLIDDVITTGATIEECTRTLKKAGAAKVNVLALAKTI